MESQNTLHPTRKIHLWILTLLFSISYISNGYCESHNANDWKSSYTSVTESAGVFIAQKRTTYCGIPKTYLVDRSGKRITPAFRDIGMFCNGLAEFVEAKNDADRKQSVIPTIA
jgi:hypothetical protein